MSSMLTFSPLNNSAIASLKKDLKHNGFVVFHNPWGDEWVAGLEQFLEATPVRQTNGQIIYPITANSSATGKSDAQSLGIGLLPHTEWSYKALPPKWLCLRGQTPDRWGGGATTLVNFRDLLRHFTLEEQQFMAEKNQYFMSKNGKENYFAPIWQRELGIIRFSYNVLIHKQFSPDLYKPIPQGCDRFLMGLCNKILDLYENYSIPIHLKKRTNFNHG